MSFKLAIKKCLWASIPYHWNKIFAPNSPKNRYYKYIIDNGYTRYPYTYAHKYLSMHVVVNLDMGKDLYYVVHKDGKKLYFPKKYTVKGVETMYKALIMEQDLESPHCYVHSLDEFKGKNLVDIGSAEGLTSLEAIDKVDSLILFECDPNWIKALEATFEPWKEKVELHRLYIGNKNNDTECTLDEFLKNKSTDNLFLKMDIEGAETKALAGAEKLFATAKNLDFAICTYHKKNDLKLIKKFLDQYDCRYTLRDGLFYTAHSFRPALLRGFKK